MRWADMSTGNFYLTFDERQRVIRGFWLTTLNVDLENLPRILFEPFEFKKDNGSKAYKYSPERVQLDDIVGTTYNAYGGIGILDAFLCIPRAPYYISNFRVTRGKYFYMLKKPVYEQHCPIKLLKDRAGHYWVAENGNHRVILYKMMMLAEISEQYAWTREDSYDINLRLHQEIRKKYWLNALVREE